MKKENYYKNNSNFLTQRMACDELGIHPITFNKYAERFCVIPHYCGKYKYYHREDIEKMQDFFSWGAQDLITRIEKMTGKKVQLV